MSHRSAFVSTLKVAAAIGFLALAACTNPNAPDHTSAPASGTSAASAASVRGPASASTAASANAATGSIDERAQAFINTASHGAVRVDHTFAGPDGMIGVVTVTTTPDATKDVIFLSPGAKVLFPGGGITIDGQNIAQQALVDQHVYLTAQELGDKVLDRGFIVGTKGPIVTAFMDANCYWCHAFYTQIAPHIAKGEVRARFVMVGFLKPTSVGRAVAILAAKNPADALKQDETGFDLKAEEGGLAPLSAPRPDLEQVVHENMALMGKAGKISTPGLLFCTKAQGPTYVLGMPGNASDPTHMDLSDFIGNLSAKGHKACGE
jgi:thiol:disulfide interchange protein DsbG